MNAPAVLADSLSLSYGSVTALEGVSFTAEPGSTTAVIGPNGSGKSTVLRAIAGLSRPSGGDLAVPARRTPEGVAFVMQVTEVDRSLPLSVGEAVRMASYSRRGLLRRLAPADRARVADALDRVELTTLDRRQLHELSGGQRQRVLVAQGLAQGSELLLLDEPFTGVDLVSKQRILEAIATEREAGRTVLYSTHDLGDARRADNVLLLAGVQVAFGTPSEVLSSGPLQEAFGARMLRMDDGTLLVDDPHHGEHDDAHHVG